MYNLEKKYDEALSIARKQVEDGKRLRRTWNYS